MADRAPAMVDPTHLAPGMAPATTSCRRASRYSASSSTAGTKGLCRALGRSPATSSHQICTSVHPVSSRPRPCDAATLSIPLNHAASALPCDRDGTAVSAST